MNCIYVIFEILLALRLKCEKLTTQPPPHSPSRCQLKCDGTQAETRFCLSAKRTSPFKSAGASVQLTAGIRGVRISVINAGYTTF